MKRARFSEQQIIGLLEGGRGGSEGQRVAIVGISRKLKALLL
jgi:hypothetical protein